MKRILNSHAHLDEAGNVDLAIEELRRAEALPPDGNCDHERFLALRNAVRETFEVPWTSITPVMERMLYAIVAAKRPAHVVAIGIYCGNTLIWNVGPACGPGKLYDAERLLGVEVDEEAIGIARGNENVNVPPHR